MSFSPLAGDTLPHPPLQRGNGLGQRKHNHEVQMCIRDRVMSFEDEFGIEVPDEQVENFHTVGDVVRYIEDTT